MYASNPFLDAVLDYSELPTVDHPLEAARQGPRSVKWEAHQTRHATLTELNQWFAQADRNVGIVTGDVSRCGCRGRRRSHSDRYA